MKVAVIIPARIASERLPRKPLRMIAGMSLTERVWRQAIQARGVTSVFVASDSVEVLDHVAGFGGQGILTGSACANGTERVAEAVSKIEPVDVVMNVQGDEPLLAPAVIEAVASAFSDPRIQIATPISPLGSTEELLDPNVVKCAVAANGNALYFSRSPIPHVRSRMNVVHDGVHWKHIGVYGFHVKTLRELVSLPPSQLEESEKLEQLRWLEHGYTIRTVPVEYDSVSVDTEDDVTKVEHILARQ